MGFHIGDIAPDFTADTSTDKNSFHDGLGNDRAFFSSHPNASVPFARPNSAELRGLIR